MSCSYGSRDRNSYGLNAFAKILIDHGADPNYVDDSELTPLSIAAGFANANLVKYLLEAGGDTEFLLPHGKTIREVTYEEGFPEIIELFEKY